MIAGLVLAAGAGRRFGMPKALVRYEGALFVDRTAGTLVSAGCAPVLVVIGAAADQVRAESALAASVFVENPEWTIGMGSGLRAGITALTGSAAVAVVVMPVDTPWVTSAAVRRLTALAAPDALVRATYDGKPGHPVLIGRAHWAGVAELAAGDAGAREYLRAHPPLDVPCEDIADGRDVDRAEDLSSS